VVGDGEGSTIVTVGSGAAVAVNVAEGIALGVAVAGCLTGGAADGGVGVGANAGAVTVALGARTVGTAVLVGGGEIVGVAVTTTVTGM